MNSFKKILGGAILGIILFIVAIILIGMNIAHKLEKDYKDEVRTIAHVIEQSKDPLVQKDYLIAGLLMSPQFQTYLEEGVEDGWWTEEFLTQQFTDDLLPIYLGEFAGIARLLGDGDLISKIKENLSAIQGAIERLRGELANMDVDKLKETLINLRNKIMSLDINRLLLVIGDLKDLISNLDLDHIKEIIEEIKKLGLDDKLADLKDQIDDLKGKLEEIKDKLGNISIDIAGIKDKLEEIKDKLSDMDLEEIRDKLKEIKDKLEEIKDKLDDLNLDRLIIIIKSKIRVFIHNLKDFISDLGEIIENIKDTIEDILADISSLLQRIKNWLLADVKPDYDWNGAPLSLPPNVIKLLNAIDIHIVYEKIDTSTASVGTCSTLPGSPSTCFYVYNVSITLENVAQVINGNEEEGGFRYVIPVNRPLQTSYGFPPKPTGVILNIINNNL